jgi:uncharacterized membrane protein
VLRTRSCDDGSLSLLIIGYTFIAALLIVVGIDVSKVFLAQRSLSSAADAAALAGAQAVDRAALYAGTAACANLPVDPSAAQTAVIGATEDAATSLHGTFVSVSSPDVHVDGGTVRVGLHGRVRVPFGRVLSLLLPDSSDGSVGVSAEAAAASALSVPRC